MEVNGPPAVYMLVIHHAKSFPQKKNSDGDFFSSTISLQGVTIVYICCHSIATNELNYQKNKSIQLKQRAHQIWQAHSNLLNISQYSNSSDNFTMSPAVLFYFNQKIFVLQYNYIFPEIY